MSTGQNLSCTQGKQCDRFPELEREAFDSTIGAFLLSGSGGFAGKGWTVRLEQSFLMVPVSMTFLGDDLHRISVLCEIHSVGR